MTNIESYQRGDCTKVNFNKINHLNIGLRIVFIITPSFPIIGCVNLQRNVVAKEPGKEILIELK